MKRLKTTLKALDGSILILDEIKSVSEVMPDIIKVIDGNNEERWFTNYKILNIEEVEIKICVLCKQKFTGYGNNPEPLSNKGKCCDKCNSEKVIPARLEMIKY